MAKRLFDLFFSSIGLIISSPLLLVVTLLIKLDSQGSVFFRQIRIGKNLTPFTIYKFRTMVDAPRQETVRLAAVQDYRITRLGRFLRKTKIDELPQLINVVIGQMSLVGPRPEVLKYVEKWPEDAKKQILSIKPGIADYASFCYGNEEEVLAQEEDPESAYVNKVMPHKLRLYLRYLREQNLWLDLRIILATLGKLAGINVAVLLPELKSELSSPVK